MTNMDPTLERAAEKNVSAGDAATHAGGEAPADAWPVFDPAAPVPPGAAGSALAKGTLAPPQEAQKPRFILRLKWYYLLTAGLAVLTLFAALYGATEIQQQYQSDATRAPSPLTFFLPLLGIGGVGVLLYLVIDALCAFCFRPKNSYRRLHFFLNLLLYLSIVLGWPVAIAALSTFR
ncbi:MAG: hypothetical protein ACTTJE_03320 [Schwartzia sp. (in: firmicutes)]